MNESSQKLIIRPATPSDVPAITEIYNGAILRTVATFDTELKTVTQQRAWFDDHDERHPILVAELAGRIVGWAALSKWSVRPAYADTAEVSLYVGEEFRSRGIGRKLLEAILAAGKRVNLHSVIGAIAEGNPASIHLLEEMGFEHVGILRECGRKFGQLLDVHLMQKIYA